MRAIVRTYLLEAAGGKEEIERKKDGENDDEEKEEARGPPTITPGAGLLARGPLLHHFQLHHAQEHFRVGWFGLALAIGIHRKES